MLALALRILYLLCFRGMSNLYVCVCARMYFFASN